MNEAEYGTEYRVHLLEQYKIYVEMADRISQRRATANNFFLTLHSGLIAIGIVFLGLATQDAEYGLAAVTTGVFGLSLSILWRLILKSYRQLNGAKYTIVGELEAKLPVAPYDDEWEKLGRGEDSSKYLKLTVVEERVTYVFMAGYVALAVLAVYILNK